VEDQQASTVKGEEELSPELNDEAAELQDTELEASPEVVQGDSESVEEPETEVEEAVAEVEEAVAEVEEAVAEIEEPEAEAEEPEAEVEEAVAEIEEPGAVVEEAVAEIEEPEAEIEEPGAEVEASVSDESQEEAAAEVADEAADPVEELEIASMEGEALTESPSVESPVNGNDGQVAEELATQAEAETPARRVAEPDDGREWYVVHCYSGYENKVRHNLEQRIETMDMKGKIFDVVVPTEEEMEVKEGKRRTVERRVFPGYILVQMIMDEDSWYVVRNTPGVTGFVGMGNEPTPLRPEEVSQIVRRMEADAPRIKVTYDVGQKVRIIDGPFNDFIGTVDDIDMDKAKVRVMVSFFGRETPVELDFLQVEKA
jgi:transcriptional antiterminator NusG